jgi:signal transduction histidine kinase
VGHFITMDETGRTAGGVPDWQELLAVDSILPTPVDDASLRMRLRLTVLAAVEVLLGMPALALAILTLVSIPLAPLGVGLALAHAVVPATRALNDVHRRLAGWVLRDGIEMPYADTTGRGFIGRPVVWFRDPARWRGLAHLGFSGTGGLVMSGLIVGTLANPVVAAVLMVFDPSVGSAIFFFALSPVVLTAWWAITPGLTLGRATADRGILGPDRSAELERRVDEVTTARDETLDHSAAEVRRIERDLHDGAQARLAAVGMNVGLAERLMATDPAAAAELLREARETTVAALEDLRAVVRGIHPPVLADRGLAGAIDALAVAIPLPITVTADADLPRLPAPVESAAYFAVAECLANTVKHAGAGRAWIQLSHDGTRLRVVVGDDGRGGADTGRGTGLTGVRRRVAAFDGTMTLTSPVGGPTVVTLEIPCASSSPRTRPSSGPA